MEYGGGDEDSETDLRQPYLRGIRNQLDVGLNVVTEGEVGVSDDCQV